MPKRTFQLRAFVVKRLLSGAIRQVVWMSSNHCPEPELVLQSANLSALPLAWMHFPVLSMVCAKNRFGAKAWIYHWIVEGGGLAHVSITTGVPLAALVTPRHLRLLWLFYRRSVTLAAFYIDVREVTNAEFLDFVTAKGYTTTAERNGSSYIWNTHTKDFDLRAAANWRQPGGPGTNIDGAMDLPVVHVSYEDAAAYCAWVHKRLPTEAEWEKAARGPDGRLFPWGDEWRADGGNYALVGPGGATLVNGLRPGGSFPAGDSYYGVQDLLGNVAEWVADVYDPDYYRSAPNRNPYNLASPANRPAVQHSRRGGSWATKPGYLHAAWRIDRPDDTTDTLGFRCARNP